MESSITNQGFAQSKISKRIIPSYIKYFNITTQEIPAKSR